MPGRLAASMAVVAALAMAVVTLLSAGGQAAGLVGDPVLVGAGDIASCSSSGDEATANLLEGIDGTIAALGDNAYDKGTIAEYQDCYGPSWGRHVGDGQQNLLARTKPSVGNH